MRMMARISTLRSASAKSVSRFRSNATLFPGMTLTVVILRTSPQPLRNDTWAEQMAPVAAGLRTPGLSRFNRAVWPSVRPTIPSVWTCGYQTGRDVLCAAALPAIPVTINPNSNVLVIIALLIHCLEPALTPKVAAGLSERLGGLSDQIAGRCQREHPRRVSLIATRYPSVTI